MSSSGDPPSPVAAADQDNHGNDARRGQNDVSRPPQRNQIGIILVGRSEYENRTSEPDQDEADTFEDLHEKEWSLRRETMPSPVSNLSPGRERISKAARKLHKNPELLQSAFHIIAQPRQIVRPANQWRLSNAYSHTAG